MSGQQGAVGLDGGIPLAVEIVGAIDRVQQVMGFPKKLPYPLTTCGEAADIMEKIDAAGIKGVHYKLSGFINGGVRQKMLGRVRVVGKLGSASSLVRLAEQADRTGSRLYLDGTMQFAYRSGLTDGFSYYGSPARFVSQKLCELNEYSKVYYSKDPDGEKYHLLRPALAQAASEKLTAAAGRFGAGVSYRDFGDVLSADYNEKRRVSREEAMQMQRQAFASAMERGIPVMVNGGNAYAVRDADFITNLDLAGNAYSIIDYPVPFYQIALHGYRSYAGGAMNLAPDRRQLLLESAQTAAGLYFTFMQASEKAVQETSFTQYYAASFDEQQDEFAALYRDYNARLGALAGRAITDFCYVNPDVSVTAFEGGDAVVVNFGSQDYIISSGTAGAAGTAGTAEAVVPARDYLVLKDYRAALRDFRGVQADDAARADSMAQADGESQSDSMAQMED